MLFFGLILIVISGAFVGYSLSGELAKREENLRTFKNFLLFLKNEIIYKISPVREAVDKYCAQKSTEDDIAKVFKDLCNQDDKQYDVSELYTMVENRKHNLFFLECDMSVVRDFFENLGKSDLDGQKELFETTLIRLEDNINDAKSIRAQKSKMYRALGIGAGAIIALLIV